MGRVSIINKKKYIFSIVFMVIFLSAFLCRSIYSKADNQDEQNHENNTTIENNQENSSNDVVDNNADTVSNNDVDNLNESDVSEIDNNVDDNMLEQELEDYPMDNMIQIEKIPIVVNEKNINLVVGETKALFYKNVTYSVSNKEIISVTNNGLVKAKKAGIASVILSNETTSVCINVFVKDSSISNMVSSEVSIISNDVVPLSGIQGDDVLDMLAKKIADSVYEYVSVSHKEITSVSSYALEQLYMLKKNLSIIYDDYKVVIYGEELEDYDKSLKANFDIKASDKYKDSFTLKVEDDLPGKVELRLKDSKYNKKYIYVYNNSQKKYVLLADNNKEYVELRNNEEYLFTDIDLDRYVVNVKVLVIIAITIIILMIIYVIVKKRYWFW